MSFKQKKVISTSKPIELIHLDLFGPSQTKSPSGNYYGFVIVEDYSRFTWMPFLAHMNDTFKAFVDFAKVVQNVYSFKIITLCSDHGGEFVDHHFQNFCTENMVLLTISHVIELHKKRCCRTHGTCVESACPDYDK